MTKYRALRFIVQLNPQLWFRLSGHRDLGNGDELWGIVGPLSVITTTVPATTSVFEIALSFQHTTIGEAHISVLS